MTNLIRHPDKSHYKETPEIERYIITTELLRLLRPYVSDNVQELFKSIISRRRKGLSTRTSGINLLEPNGYYIFSGEFLELWNHCINTFKNSSRIDGTSMYDCDDDAALFFRSKSTTAYVNVNERELRSKKKIFYGLRFLDSTKKISASYEFECSFIPHEYDELFLLLDVLLFQVASRDIHKSYIYDARRILLLILAYVRKTKAETLILEASNEV